MQGVVFVVETPPEKHRLIHLQVRLARHYRSTHWALAYEVRARVQGLARARLVLVLEYVARKLLQLESHTWRECQQRRWA